MYAKCFRELRKATDEILLGVQKEISLIDFYELMSQKMVRTYCQSQYSDDEYRVIDYIKSLDFEVTDTMIKRKKKRKSFFKRVFR